MKGRNMLEAIKINNQTQKSLILFITDWKEEKEEERGFLWKEEKTNVFQSFGVDIKLKGKKSYYRSSKGKSLPKICSICGGTSSSNDFFKHSKHFHFTIFTYPHYIS